MAHHPTPEEPGGSWQTHGSGDGLLFGRLGTGWSLPKAGVVIVAGVIIDVGAHWVPTPREQR